MENFVLYVFTLAISTSIAIPCARNPRIGFLRFIGGWTLAWVVFLGAHPTRVTALILIGLLGYGVAILFFSHIRSEDTEPGIEKGDSD